MIDRIKMIVAASVAAAAFSAPASAQTLSGADARAAFIGAIENSGCAMSALSAFAAAGELGLNEDQVVGIGNALIAEGTAVVIDGEILVLVGTEACGSDADPRVTAEGARGAAPDPSQFSSTNPDVVTAMGIFEANNCAMEASAFNEAARTAGLDTEAMDRAVLSIYQQGGLHLEQEGQVARLIVGGVCGAR